MTTLASGSRIGGYEIVAPLRAGGMASFYLARRVGPAGFTRPIGIKVVHAHLAADRSFVDMFLDEARLSARIVHPNVVHVEELGESDGMFFLAMELVHGAPLSALLRRLSETHRVLTVPVACAIAMRVADGLHAAHEVKDDAGVLLEVVHRDVSPQNILVGADGRVKLIDFGIAKARGRLQETEGGSLKGKLRYMSPEQAWGKPLDRRSDVYALGIVLWESLTGRRLFGGETDMDALERVRAPQIPDPSELEDSVSPSIDAVLRTALAREPADRFDTAQAFRKALGHACPEAAKVEPDEIGALVRTLLGPDLDRERSLLGSFSGVVPEPRKDDEALATDAMHETRQILSDEPVATISAGVPGEPGRRNYVGSASQTTPAEIAATRVLAPTAPAPKKRSRVGYVLAVLAVTTIGGFTYVALPRSPPGPCEGVVAIPAGDGARVVTPFDNRDASLEWVLHDMRHPTALAEPTCVFSYVVPGTGPRTVEMNTAVELTDPLFDTMIGVYHGSCDPSMATRAPDVAFDDDDEGLERRARGELRANGGDVLTLVVTGYGGHVHDHIDEGPGAIAMTTRVPSEPTLVRATVRLENSEIHLEVVGDDPDGDTASARLRFEGREGAPIATLRFPELSRPPGAFTVSAMLDVGPEGRRTMSTAETVEVSLLDVAGNASAPMTVPLTITRPADGGI